MIPMPGCTATGGSGKRALGYLGHVVMENRSGLLIDTLLTPATGTAECQAALVMMSRRPGDHRITVGSDKGYDTRAFVAELRHLARRPTWPNARRPPVAAVRSMRAPRAIPATRSVSASASWWGPRSPEAPREAPASHADSARESRVVIAVMKLTFSATCYH